MKLGKIRELLTLSGLSPRLRLLCFGSIGALLGMGLYVGHISNAASYLSDDPEACINCHIMIPQYASWQHSSHAKVASCNDCHVPHNNEINKYFFKAKDGLRHSVLFTLRQERQVIACIPESQEVIQENCIRCHAQTVSELKRSEVVAGSPNPHADTSRSCIECHREVPHGRVHSLSSTPNAAVPPLSPVVPKWLSSATESKKDQK